MSASKNVVPLRRSLPLVRYDAMCQAITECHGIDEVMEHHAEAAVMAEAYARIANDTENERKCREIQRRAERRCGEMLADMEKAKRGPDVNGKGSQHRQTSGNARSDTLADLGITYDQSSQWQRLAKVPEPEFEQAIAGPGPVPSARDIVARHGPDQRSKTPVLDKVDPLALWLWGQLKDFEREGVLNMDPNVLLKTMLDHMKETTVELAPRISAWLGRIRV